MRKIAFALILALACGKAKVDTASKPLSVPGEKVYAMHGKIVGRDASENSLTIDHEGSPATWKR